jgi:hypothetical protein
MVNAIRVAARFVAPDALPPGDFDIVIANISPIPCVLAPLLTARVRRRWEARPLRHSRASGCRRDGELRTDDPLPVHATDDGWALLTGFRS